MSKIFEKENPTYEDLILYFEENYRYLERKGFKTDEFYYVASKYLNIGKKANVSSYSFHIKNKGESFYYKFRFDRKKDILFIQKFAGEKNKEFELLKSFSINKIYNRYIEIIDTEISIPIVSNYKPDNYPSSIEKSLNKIYQPPGIKLLKLTKFLFSPKTQRDVFEVIYADWQNEYSEALFKNEVWKERWINVRYTYAFLIVMWQKSPIGDLIEFISKIAKQ